MSNRKPPADINAEKWVLSACFLDAVLIPQIRDEVRPRDFMLDRHRWIFEAICAVDDREGAPVDLVTVGDALNRAQKFDAAGGDDYLLDLMGYAPSAAGVGEYARLVRDAATLREIMKAGSRMIDLAGEADPGDPMDVIDQVQREIQQLVEGRETRGAKTMDEIQSAAIDVIEWRYNNRDKLTGVGTGLPYLDGMTNGWQPGDLAIIAGRPGMGKTAFGLGAAIDAAHQGKRVLFFSLEMTPIQLYERVAGVEAGVDVSRLRSGRLDADDFNRLTRHSQAIGGLPLLIDDTPTLSIAQVRSRARRMAMDRRGGLDLLVVDYLQLMSGTRRTERDGRHQVIAEISRGLKLLAKELEVPVVALSQLNRDAEKRTDKRPSMADLRESGAIEQDADLVLLLYRPEVYDPTPENKGNAEIIVAKNRQGKTDRINLRFNAERMRFRESAPTSMEAPAWMD